MSRWRTQRNRLDDFLAHGLWESQGEGISKRRRFFYHNIRIGVIVFRKFFEDRCPMRASSLTYTSLLAIVPLFALMFSVLKGFGVQNTLETIILKKITIGSEEIVHHIVGYINNTNAARLGALGLAILILTVMAMLSNIEKSFNHIWGVRETRSTFRRFSDFLSVLVLGPVFIFAAISMTSTLQSQVFLQRLLEMAYVGEVILILFKTLPFVVMWAAFTFLYIFMPNAKVRLASALVGGIFPGGTIWQLAQWGFVYAQVGVARYNAIYGTLAALPILMVWIYFSWIIVLLGLIVTYAWQNTEIIRRETSEQSVSFMCREKAALAILILVTRKFYENGRPWDLQHISSHLNLPPRLRMRVLDELVDLGFLSEVFDEGEESAYLPAKAPERVAVADVIAEFRRQGESLECSQEVNEWYRVNELEERLQQVETHALEGMTLKELALGKAEGAKGES